MSIRQLGGLVVALGGLLWVARRLLDPAGGAGDLMRWAGLGLVLVGVAAIGLTLVTGRTRWLDPVVALAAAVLFWAVYAMFRSTFDGTTYDGVVGVACVLAGAAMVVRPVRRDGHEGHGGAPAKGQPGRHSA